MITHQHASTIENVNNAGSRTYGRLQSIYFCISIIVMLTLVNGVFARDEGSDDETLTRLELADCKAQLNAATSELDGMWATEYTFTAPTALVVDKATYLSMLKSGTLKYDSLKFEDINVKVYGDSALVTGRAVIQGRVGTHEITGQDRFLSVYIKRDGRWQKVATVATRIGGI